MKRSMIVTALSAVLSLLAARGVSAGWTRVADMPSGRTNAAAAVAVDASGRQKVFVLGGGEAWGVDTVESYDPTTDTWTSGLAPIPTARADLAAVTYTDGMIYAIAGSNAGGQKIERYDPVADTWDTSLPNLTWPPRMGAAAAVAQDGSGTWNIYVTGGLHAGNNLQRVDYWSSTAGYWQSAAPMLVKRWRHRAVAHPNGKIYVFGGGDPRIEEYDPASDTWSFTGVSLPATYHGIGATMGRYGWVYLIGGAAVPCGLDQVWRYNPLSNVLLTAGAGLTEPRGHAATATVADCLYAIGGYRKLCGHAGQITEELCLRRVAQVVAHAAAVIDLSSHVQPGAAVEVPVSFHLEVADGGDPVELDWTVSVRGCDSCAVSAGGLPPDEWAGGRSTVRPGERVPVSLSVQIAGEVPARSEVVLSGDADGDGTVEDLAVTVLRFAGPCEDPAPRFEELVVEEGAKPGERIVRLVAGEDSPADPEVAGRERAGDAVAAAGAGDAGQVAGGAGPLFAYRAESRAGEVIESVSAERSVVFDLEPGEWLLSVASVPRECEEEGEWLGVWIEVVAPALFRRGDANFDGQVDLSDSVRILGELFLGVPLGGCRDAVDVNDDGALNLGDAVFGLYWRFLGGREPPAPGPFRCGEDLTEDGLDCRDASSCAL